LITFAFLFFIPLVLENSASACQYIISDNTIPEDFDAFDFIFLGKVLQVGEYATYTPVTLQVIESWKGQPAEKILLFTCKGKDDGGLQFQEGKSYLIFAEKLSSAYPVVTDFGPTKLLSEAKDDILFLDQKSYITRFHYDNSISISLLAPLKQFKLGIPNNAITCKEGLMRFIEFNDKLICVKPQTMQKLTERGLAQKSSGVVSPFATPGHEFKTSLTVEGLNKTYSVGQKIEFTVKFNGTAYDCGYPQLRIENSNHDIIWESGGVVSLCDPDMKKDHIEKEWKIGNDTHFGTPIINKEGFYTLFVTYGDAIIQKNILISDNPNLVDEVNSRAIFSNEIIIPKGSSDPENKINVFPQSLTIYFEENHSVIWSNLDYVPSTFVADDQSWTTGIIKPGESISVGFNHTGIFNFHGEPHPWQKGTIIVK